MIGAIYPEPNESPGARRRPEFEGRAKPPRWGFWRLPKRSRCRGERWQPDKTRIFGSAAGGQPIDPSHGKPGQIALVDRGFAHFSGRAPAFGNGLHALLIAALAGTKNRDRWRVARRS